MSTERSALPIENYVHWQYRAKNQQALSLNRMGRTPDVGQHLFVLVTFDWPAKRPTILSLLENLGTENTGTKEKLNCSMQNCCILLNMQFIPYQT